jgi:NADPH:quinone reductase-like Zn-dependent oxidoreductase
MKAAVYREYGPPAVVHVEELGKPSPQAGQVLVRVHATSINAGDYRGFESPIMMRVVGGGLVRPKNVRLGSDLAGTVEAVGENVSQVKPGDEVFGCATGAFGEYVLAREAYLVPKPYGVSFAEAAALPVAGLTALQAIRYAGGIRQGKGAGPGASGGWECLLCSWRSIMGGSDGSL